MLNIIMYVRCVCGVSKTRFKGDTIQNVRYEYQDDEGKREGRVAIESRGGWGP